MPAPDDGTDDHTDDSEPPPEIDRGLEHIYGGGQPPEQDSPSIIQRIGQITGHKPSVSLREVDPAGQTPMLKPLTSSDGIAQETGKYTVHGMIGQGGVGAVHKGHDTDLGRDVAMKFLHEKYKNEPAVLHRFVEEAQIGGQLQHPGIVPVYELGMSDGRPFFTMKMVKGDTLAKKLTKRPSPATDRRAFLVIFEDICQTMAYAHARGVVHRDLKPANVMIGAFGEVQVVDWGMGKVLQSGGVADEKLAADRHTQLSVIETLRSTGHGTQSILGSVMGTPAYMAPEQARGDVDAMDERSDVFALGAILCEILTGQPPYVGEPDELIGLAAMAKLDDAHARLAACGAEPDLIELATRCMLPAQAARPQSAEEVSKAVHTHLASAEARVHEATVRALAMQRTQKLGIALTGVIAIGLAASLWSWQGARVSAEAAQDAQELATASLDNFNNLSYAERLATAKATERTLFPARQEKEEEMRDWLSRSKSLTGALPELRATLTALEARAQEEQTVDRRPHPRLQELQDKRSKLDRLKRAQAVRAGSQQLESVELDPSLLPTDPEEVMGLAYWLLYEENNNYGHDSRAIALARHSVSLANVANDEYRHAAAYNLVEFLASLGSDEEARRTLQESKDSMDEVQRAHWEPEHETLLQDVRMAGSKTAAEITRLTAEIAALQIEVGRRWKWTFTNQADQFLYGTLKKLVTDIEAFTATEVVAVKRRLLWAERVKDLTITRYQDDWREASAAIAQPAATTKDNPYADVPIRLTPQLGLVPIGMNPVTRLWEFYHLRSGWDPELHQDPADIEIPTHDPRGHIDMDGRGVVFVLIPGGKFFMGAQATDENRPNYDPDAVPTEGPVRKVELRPYFVSKYELTKGQWARLSAVRHLSQGQFGDFNEDDIGTRDSHPVRNVSWAMCNELLEQHGLGLPTEAQWERACRANTSTPWNTGTSAASLEGSANVLDKRTRTGRYRRWGGEEFDDGFKDSTPVGTFAANEFGLFDTHGNVEEWCRDWWATYARPPRSGDGLREGNTILWGDFYRICRGGSHRMPAFRSRAAARRRPGIGIDKQDLGVRPSREITR